MTLTMERTTLEVGTRVKVPEYHYLGNVKQPPVYRKVGTIVANSADTDRHYPGSVSVWIDGQPEMLPHVYLAESVVTA